MEWDSSPNPKDDLMGSPGSGALPPPTTDKNTARFQAKKKMEIEAQNKLRQRLSSASRRKQIRKLTEVDERNWKIYQKLKEIENTH